MAIEGHYERSIPLTPNPELYKGRDIKLVKEVHRFLETAGGLEANLMGAVAGGTRQYDSIGICVTPKRGDYYGSGYQSVVQELTGASEGERKLYDWEVRSNSEKKYNEKSKRIVDGDFIILKRGTNTKVHVKLERRKSA